MFKNRLKKILCLILTITCFLNVSACVKEQSKPTEPLEPTLQNAPDYSESKLQFDFYAYNGPTDGTWTENGILQTAGQDFRTVERFKEYKDAGLNVYFPGLSGHYGGGDWSNSNAKSIMDKAYTAGIEKIIVCDTRLQDLSGSTTESLIGSGKRFATQDELDEYVTSCMKDYRKHQAFYGVMLKDEPSYEIFEGYGQVYKSIKRVCPNAFVQTNLLPMIRSNSAAWYPPLTDDEKAELETKKASVVTALTGENEILATERVVRYKKYLEMFLDATGADYFMYDQYPMNEDYIYHVYIEGLQVASSVAKERGVKFYNVTQTMRMVQNLNASKPTKQRFMQSADAYWLNNMLVGFGVKQIVYYTYWTYAVNNNDGWFYDNGSFVNRNGTKTDLYNIMQRIMKELQDFAPTVLNYDFVTSKIIKHKDAQFDNIHIQEYIKGDEFTKLKSTSIDKEIALVTELYDDEKELYMYMFQNITDPIEGNIYQQITAEFEDCTHAVIFEKGKREVVELENGKLTMAHNPGYATYVIPFKGIIK